MAMVENDVAPGDEVAAGESVSGGRLQALLNAMPIPAYLCDRNGLIVAFNTKTVEFWGDVLQIGKSDKVLRVVAPAWSRTSPAVSGISIQQVLGKPHVLDDIEILVDAGTGEPLRAFASVTRLDDSAELFLKSFRMVARTRDGLSQQQKAEQTRHGLDKALKQNAGERTPMAKDVFSDLRRSERDFALLIGSITDYAIFMLDPQGIITSWNIGAERIKGYRTEEIIGEHFSRFYTPEDRTAAVPAMALETARREGRYNAEGWRVRKDGSRFWASVVIDPISDRGVLVGFAKITRDVTERMEAEAALVQSEYLARGVIDTALDGFVQLDEEGRIVRWNPQAETLFGWSRDEAMGQSLSTLIAADGDRERFIGTLSSGAAVHEAGQQAEVLSREGRKISVEFNISSIPLNDGHRTNIFIRDLTEKNLIEAQLRQAQKMEAVGQLTGGLAHDFNNLLQGIIGALDLIQMRVEAGDTADVARFVNGALNSASRAAAMTHRLLAFSRRQPLDPRPVLANPLILSMADLLHRTLGEQITLEFELAPELWPTLCDPNQLESAVLNLSINARDAMSAGGRLLIRSRNVSLDEMKVDKRAEAIGEQYVCIEVADSGIGMAADVLDRVFEPFFTTKMPGHGTGLGLSMVYGFARQSNGFCEVQSEPGNGTTVTLYLPHHAGVAADEEMAMAVPAVLQGKGESVLVVEDEGMVRHIVVEVLQQIGYTALVAVDGEAGLALLQSNEAIHLLISDIGLPGMNGRSLANAARRIRPDLKVLLMTGYASDVSAAGGFAAGMELITKPFTVESLANRLRKMLE
jgi:PAS domain S-box-containing protein